MAAVDYAYARYTYSCVGGDPLKASLYASLIMALTGVTVLTYTADPWLLPVAILGAFVGTWLGVEKS